MAQIRQNLIKFFPHFYSRFQQVTEYIEGCLNILTKNKIKNVKRKNNGLKFLELEKGLSH
jgi:hypothetical protein